MKAPTSIKDRRELILLAIAAASIVLVTGGTGAFALYASLRLPAGATLTISVSTIGWILSLNALAVGLILFGIFKIVGRLIQAKGNEDQAS